VEKPPCLTGAELDRLRAAEVVGGTPLTVGFNRRHAPLARALRNAVRRPGEPFELLCRVSAGALPEGHWLNDLVDGGGRLIGEGCHFVDFACWFADALPVRVTASLRATAGAPIAAAQAFTVVLDFGDGSLATIVYGAENAASMPKERFEAHSRGRSAVLDDFTTLTTFGARPRRRRPAPRDKGHTAQFAALRALVSHGTPLEGPAPLDTMAVTLAALQSALIGQAVSLRAESSRA
jgi:predicted dehydrogenase